MHITVVDQIAGNAVKFDTMDNIQMENRVSLSIDNGVTQEDAVNS